MTISWNSTVYTQERNILQLSGFNSASVAVRLSCSALNIYADYAKPATGALVVDLSDLVRLRTSGTFTLEEIDASGSRIGSLYSRNWTASGLINPAAFVAPDTSGPSDSWYTVCAHIMPPNMILQGESVYSIEIGGGVSKTVALEDQDGEFLTNLTVGSGSKLININVGERIGAISRSGIPESRIEFRKQDNCREYVTIIWMGRLGQLKRFVWEARNFKITSQDIVNIESVEKNGVEYYARKGFAESFTARLEDLDSYDFWYYSDIVSSSHVRVIYGGVTYVADVTTKELAIPNGTGASESNLEVQIKLREYDTNTL